MLFEGTRMNQNEIINYNLLKATLRNLVENKVKVHPQQSEEYYEIRLGNIVNFRLRFQNLFFLIYSQLKSDNNTEFPYLKRLELENRSISELQKLLVTESILKELE
jgi:hypothetical protein